MPRLNRTLVLTVLIISSSVFLLFQLYYYRKYVNKSGPHILSQTGHLTANDVQWQTVKKFLALTHRFRLPAVPRRHHCINAAVPRCFASA
ncbi:hypothetical protein fugu_018845 [Takifugu bimaculatus]|uniref:Ribitol-5-phosphate transferase FKTN N-terminal domain-containing protein n=1 Tax=Takifugu bimaculatus TaxID=433685 RepID=A0A4Z2BHJ1_9TELE|nr:hypothetical protein fugu_018845 [Takifugu bimaculatus]